MSDDGDLIEGRYRMIERIGGLDGSVWRGRDELLGRAVAIKVLAPQPDSAGLADVPAAAVGAAGPAGDSAVSVVDVAGPAAVQARRAVRAAAKVHHPNVVTVHDVVDWKGTPALVMEYVPGRSLAAALADTGPLGPADVAGIGAQLAAALAEAHRAGILHRDVRPDNVLLAGSGTAKLAGFGLAHPAVLDADVAPQPRSAPDAIEPVADALETVPGSAETVPDAADAADAAETVPCAPETVPGSAETVPGAAETAAGGGDAPSDAAASAPELGAESAPAVSAAGPAPMDAEIPVGTEGQVADSVVPQSTRPDSVDAETVDPETVDAESVDAAVPELASSGSVGADAPDGDSPAATEPEPDGAAIGSAGPESARPVLVGTEAVAGVAGKSVIAAADPTEPESAAAEPEPGSLAVAEFLSVAPNPAADAPEPANGNAILGESANVVIKAGPVRPTPAALAQACLAPELADAALPTPAIDAYALGATLYAAVNGTSPGHFGPADDLPFTGQLAGAAPDRAGPLRGVITRLLSADPAGRPSLAEARDELSALSHSQSVPGRSAPGESDWTQPLFTGYGVPAGPLFGTGPRIPRQRRRFGRLRATPLRVGLAGFAVAVVVGAVMVAGAVGLPGEAHVVAPRASHSAGAPNRAAMGPSAGAVRVFIVGYYALLPQHLDSAFALLTPDYQQRTGGPVAYQRFYQTIAAIRVREVSTVSGSSATAVIVFTRTDGSVSTERYQFSLVTRNGKLLIDDAHLVTVLTAAAR